MYWAPKSAVKVDLPWTRAVDILPPIPRLLSHTSIEILSLNERFNRHAINEPVVPAPIINTFSTFMISLMLFFNI